MELCLYTDSVSNLTRVEALDFAANAGIRMVEIAAGGQSAAPHLRLCDIASNAVARASFAKEISSRGLSLAAINCSAWPLHPRIGDAHTKLMREAIQLAADLEVEKIVTMSGCPGDSPNARIVNWITFPWPEDVCEVLEMQWEQAIEFWGSIAEYAHQLGIMRIALELHPLQLAYNVPTLLRLRNAVGPIIGANVDPSHMFWQQMDPVRVVRALGSAIYHVHLKDTTANPTAQALNGVLDTTSFRVAGDRAWRFCTVGDGHNATFWSSFLTQLRDVGYDDVLSIENEDQERPEQEGVLRAISFIRGVCTDSPKPSSV